MSETSTTARRFGDTARANFRIIWALLLRELSTRYGRDNIGFLWVVVEPMIFAAGVAILWSIIKPPYDHGLKLIPFIITGYMPLILIRQTVSFCVTAVRVNSDLLYHRVITPLHLFITRFLVEFIGVSFAFVIAVCFLNLIGMMSPPKKFIDLGYIYGGWLILTGQAFGMSLILGALAEMYDFVDKFVQVTTYIMIPLSGSFFMAAWLPQGPRNGILMLPFIHCFEMIRRGFFGEFVTTYFDPLYALAFAAILTMIGLFLVQFVRDRVEVL